MGSDTQERHGGPDAFARYETNFEAPDAPSDAGSHLYLWYVTPNVVVGSTDARFERVMLCVARAIAHAHAGAYYDAARSFKRAEATSAAWRTDLKRNVVCLSAERNAKAAHLCVAAVHADAISRVADARARVGLLRSLHAYLCASLSTYATDARHDEESDGDDADGAQAHGKGGAGVRRLAGKHLSDPIDKVLEEFQNDVAVDILTKAAHMCMEDDKDVARACACLERAANLARGEDKAAATAAYDEHKRVMKAVFPQQEHPPFVNAMLPPTVPLPVLQL